MPVSCVLQPAEKWLPDSRPPVQPARRGLLKQNRIKPGVVF
jgi:hypothetical protein